VDGVGNRRCPVARCDLGHGYWVDRGSGEVSGSPDLGQIDHYPGAAPLVALGPPDLEMCTICRSPKTKPARA
jgi:hypothetical protein